MAGEKSVTSSQEPVHVTGLGFLKDLVTIFGRLENKYPLLTGGV
jgi:hypothetical protein